MVHLHTQQIFHGEACIGQSMGRSKLAVVYKGRGEVGECDSYRGIAIVTAMYKLYTTALNNRLDAYCENKKLRAFTQCGFRKGAHHLHDTICTPTLHTQPLCRQAGTTSCGAIRMLC